jgi:hypothetical protein
MSIEAPAWSSAELEVMRVGLGFTAIVAVGKIQFFRPVGAPTYPVGIARVLSMQWAGSRRATRAIQLAVYLGALAYVAQVFVPFALLVLTVALVVDITFRSSFGSVNHGEHLLAVVLGAQLLAVALWNSAVHWHWHLGHVLASSQGATAAWWTVQAILAVYLTSGLSKLVNTRGRWIQRSPGLLLSAVARGDTERQMGNTTVGTADEPDPLVAWLFKRPGLTRCVFTIGLVVELASPLGLWGETALLLVGLALIALHNANGRLLGLPFTEYQLLVLVYLVNVPRLFR